VILSLDTNALIEMLNERVPRVRLAFDQARGQGHEVKVSVLVAHELRFGAAFSGSKREVEVTERLLERFEIVPFTEADADGATKVRLGLEQIGRRIGAMDMLIAGQAMNRGWAVVTANRHEFDRVDGLQVIDWTDAAESN